MNLTREEVLRKAEPIPESGSAIYFLIDTDEITYVGQTQDLAGLQQRVKSHRKHGKRFNQFAWFELSDSENLDVEEARHILKFNPVHNKKIPVQDVWKPICALSRMSGKTRRDLRKLFKLHNVPTACALTGFMYGVYEVAKVRAAGVQLIERAKG